MNKILVLLFIVSIPAYSQIPQGEIIESFENTAEWTLEGSGAYSSLESLHSEGASSIKLGTTASERASMTKTISLNFNDYKVFSIDVYTPDYDPDLRRSIRVELSSSPTFARHFRANIYAGHRLYIGWTRLYFSKEDFADGYGPESWSNTMIRIKFTEWIEDANYDYAPSFTTFDNFTGYKVRPPAIAIISFDDNEKSSMTIGKPIMDALGFKGVQFVIGSTADQNLTSWLNWSDYDSLYADGWDISNHTYTHPQLSTLDATSLELEINGMRDLLISRGYLRSCDFIAYPYSDFNLDVLDKVKEHHKIGRSAEDWSYNAHPSSVLNDYYLIRVHSEWDDLSMQLQDIDKAIERGQLLVYMFHDISGYADRFTATMQYLKTKQDAGQIQVMTLSQYWDYIHAITPGVTVKAKAFLQGPYNPGTASMNTSLVVPATSPYSDHRSVASVPSGVVDWVKIEIRSSLSGPAAASRSAFIKSDGSIVDDDGTSDISFQVSPGYYYIVVGHRNHLGIISSSPVELSQSSSLYDFTTAMSKAHTSGQNPMAALTGGKFGLVAGDTDGNGTIDHAADIMTLWYPGVGLSGYNNADYNLDGTVEFNNDIALWLPNFGLASQVPGGMQGKAIRKEQVQEVIDKYGFSNYSRKFEPGKDGDSCHEFYIQNNSGSAGYKAEIRENEIPKEFSISQNYPNPFNPVTTVRYSLKEDAHVVMNLFNSIGEKVNTLVDQTKPAGTHTLSIDAKDLANGTYILNVTVNGPSEKKNESIKLMLMK
jgi:peptidoglycan/xylan/chitin deacetylase (PgdA/CDA1 family)